MDYLNKTDRKYINKILRKHVSKLTPLKKNPVYYKSDKLPVYCYVIKNVQDYIDYVEPTKRDIDEWYVILSINNIHPSQTLSGREYVYCNAKNIITKISEVIEPNFNDYTNIFIVPKGSVSFYNLVEKEKLWIR